MSRLIKKFRELLGMDSIGRGAWRRKYLNTDETCNIAVSADVVDGLKALERITAVPAAWWSHRLLLQHVHGRSQLEQVEPLAKRDGSYAAHHNAADAQQVAVPLALQTDLHGLASQANITLADYTSTALRLEIYGAVNAAPDASANWSEDDVAMKVWMPTHLNATVKLLAEHFDMSASDVVRNFLLIGLVGRLGFEHLVASGAWLPKRRADDFEVPMFRRKDREAETSMPTAPRTKYIAQHGKSTEAFKLYCPAVMKTLLGDIAERDGLRPSEYGRRMLTVAMLGRFDKEPA